LCRRDKNQFKFTGYLAYFIFIAGPDSSIVDLTFGGGTRHMNVFDRIAIIEGSKLIPFFEFQGRSFFELSVSDKPIDLAMILKTSKARFFPINLCASLGSLARPSFARSSKPGLLMYQFFVSPKQEVTLIENALVSIPHGLIIRPTGSPPWNSWMKHFTGRWCSGKKPSAGATVEEVRNERTKLINDEAAAAAAGAFPFQDLPNDFDYVYMLHPFGFYAYGHLFDSLQRLQHALPATALKRKILCSRTDRIVDFEQHTRKIWN
jgi:hypothetical protein